MFSSLALLRRLAQPTRNRWLSPRWLGLLVALACFIAALARPQTISETGFSEASGIEISIALDVSRSMTARDFRLYGRLVDRLTAAKAVTADFLDLRPNDRIGLIAFAGRPYPVSPITLQHDWLKRNLRRVEIGLVEDGTAIGLAIASAANRLQRETAKSKIVVLITDGSNTVDELGPLTAAGLAAKLGIRVYTIGVGSPGEQLLRMPNGMTARMESFDEETLQEIADLTGGTYFRADSTDSLARTFRDIDELEKSELQVRTVKEAREWFPWVLAAGLLCWLLTDGLPALLRKTLP